MSDPGEDDGIHTVDGVAIQARAIFGGVHYTPSSSQFTKPQQLPTAPRGFVGRNLELELLDNAIEGTRDNCASSIVLIGGCGGVGKTWLALRWACSNLDRFPDGQLYVDLKGFDVTGEPLVPNAAIRAFLDAFHVKPALIPVEFDVQIALYRSLIAGRRMILILDNARDTDQVIPLLPGGSSCAVVITSRRQLTGVIAAHNAVPISLSPLGDSESRELLTQRLGSTRVSGEPVAASELVNICGGLPLALSIVASRAALYPDRRLSSFSHEFQDLDAHLEFFDGGDLQSNIRAVFSWSYRMLSTEQKRTFRLLGIFPGFNISVSTTSALIGISPRTAASLLQELERFSLIDRYVDGRWHLHNLVKAYAAECAEVDMERIDRVNANQRLVDHYLHSAFYADHLLYPHNQSIELESAEAAANPHIPSDGLAALRWFDDEHENLLSILHLALQQRLWRKVWQLAWTMDAYHFRRGHRRDHLTTWHVGLIAAQNLRDDTMRSFAHRLLGCAHSRLEEHSEALDHLHRALELADNAEDLYNQSNTHLAIAKAWGRQDQNELALDHATQSLRLFRMLDDPLREADALNTVGCHTSRLGRYAEAVSSCQQALALCRRYEYTSAEAHVLKSLADIASRTREFASSVAYYQRSLMTFEAVGDIYEVADVLDSLGRTYDETGAQEQAIDSWRRALEMYRAQYRFADSDRVANSLGGLGG